MMPDDEEDEFEEIIPEELLPKLRPGQIAEIDQIRAKAKDIGLSGMKEGRDPEETVVDVVEELLKLREIKPDE
jgi:hypothetical protein